MRAAFADASTEFEKEVLSDGEISRSEYDEAVRRFTDCVTGRGVQITAIQSPDGLYVYEVAGEPADSTMFDCAQGTTYVIESLYSSVIKNPNNVDEDELFVDCLKRSGLATADFDVDDWLASQSTFQLDASGNVVGQSGPSGSLPFDENDPRFDACLANPSFVE